MFIPKIGRGMLNGVQQDCWYSYASLWWLTTTDSMPSKNWDDFALLLSEDHDVEALIGSLKANRNYLRANAQDLDPFAFDYYTAAPVMDLLVDLAVQANPEIFRTLDHYFNFLLKAPFENPELEEKAEEEYLEREATMPDTFDEDLISDLKDVSSYVFQDFKLGDMPNFGPGSTADAGVSEEEKLRHLWWDADLQLLGLDALMSDKESCDPDRRLSKVVFVPKTADSLRTISMEPATLSFWQEVVQDGLLRTLKKKFSLHTDLSDQGVSRTMAIKASRDGLYATLDLKAASDSISLALLERILPLRVLQVLWAVRSHETLLPNGQRVKLRKYAPMGSKVTFPLETMLFCIACAVVVWRRGLVATSIDPLFWVYGDDIIVKITIVRDVVEVLQGMGFTVNVQKSFSSGHFRESCGCNAFMGVDVTTPVLPRSGLAIYHGGELSPEGIEMLIGLCNRFLLAGFTNARRFLLALLPTDFIPFVEFQPSFLDDRKTKGKPDRASKTRIYGSSVEWSQGGIWTFHPVSNAHLKWRRVNRAWEPPQWGATTVPEILALPGYSLTPEKCPVTHTNEYRVLQSTVNYDTRHRYSDETRYAWKLRHPSKPGDEVTSSPPVGFGPRIRKRYVWAQM